MVSRDQIHAAKELINRRCETLRIFRALPEQEDVFRCTAREMLVRGGNRCSVAWSIVTKWGGGLCFLGQVSPGDVIVGVRWIDGRPELHPCSVVSKREFCEAAYQVVTESGAATAAVCDHEVYAKQGTSDQPQWVRVSGLTEGCYVSVSLPSPDFRWERVVRVENIGEQPIVGLETDLGNYVSDGFISHNSGKSTISAVRFAAIATNRPVLDHEGKPIDCRLPHQKGRKLRMWCIGYQEHHIGQTLYRLLFKSGLFKIIRDEKTGEWRTYRPWEEADRARVREVKLSPPLIPNRYIKPGSWAFKHRGNNVFTKVEIIDPETGEELAEIFAFSSTGEPKAGDPVDEIWIDEHIAYAKHYAEWQARLIDYEGRLAWSSWPRKGNNALRELTARAKDAEKDEEPAVKEFIFTMSGNPYLPQKAKDEAMAGWSDAERRTRDLGDYNTEGLLLYPNFSRRIMSAITIDGKEDMLSETLRERNGEPPSDWTRELILDPGTSHPGVLLCAIPPPEYGDFCVVYDEIYIPTLSADPLAAKVLAKIQGHHFHRFIIDGNAARQKPMSFASTVLQNYTAAFERLNIRSNETGSGFTFGSNDVAGRVCTLQSWMTIRPDGTTKLRIVTRRCPFLCQQLETVEKSMDGDVITDKPATGQQMDLSSCLEYWASRDPQYVQPPRKGSQVSPAERYLIEKRAQRAARNGPAGPIVIGPGKA